MLATPSTITSTSPVIGIIDVATNQVNYSTHDKSALPTVRGQGVSVIAFIPIMCDLGSKTILDRVHRSAGRPIRWRLCARNRLVPREMDDWGRISATARVYCRLVEIA